MRLALAVFSLAAVLAGAAPAQTPEVTLHGPPKAAAELLKVERAFAERSAEAGAKTAFAEYMDPEDSRAFMGGDPLRGAAAIAGAHGGPGSLKWWPREVWASKAGDLGFVWGTFLFEAQSAKVRVTGRYVTTWRKDAKGRWKAIIDIGTPDAKPDAG